MNPEIWYDLRLNYFWTRITKDQSRQTVAQLQPTAVAAAAGQSSIGGGRHDRSLCVSSDFYDKLFLMENQYGSVFLLAGPSQDVGFGLQNYTHFGPM